MGTKVQYKSSTYSMRDLSEDFTSCSGPLYFTDRIFQNRQFSDKISSRSTYTGSDREVVKQTILQHEAIFKYQVYELHRLYKIQREFMDEARRRGTYEEARKCHFPMANSGNNHQCCVLPSKNGGKLKEFEVPRKVGRKMFDLQLPANEYIDSEDEGALNVEDDDALSYVNPFPISGKTLGVDHGLEKLNFSKDINFNTVISSSGSNNEEQRNEKEKNHSILPWLRVAAATMNEAGDSERFANMEEVGFIRSPIDQLPDNPTRNIKSGSSSNDLVHEYPSCSRKPLGFPIFEWKNDSMNESFSLTLNDSSPSHLSNGEAKNNPKTIELDINLPCDPLDFEESKQAIDLNSCFIADEEALMGPTPSESSLIPEAEEFNRREYYIEKHKDVNQQNELQDMAAEAIVAISSLSSHHSSENAAMDLSEDPSDNLLNWFAKIVLSSGDALNEEDIEINLSEDEDFFEMMTLRLTETKKEQYMPPPLVLKNVQLEETRLTKWQNCRQKGRARKGRRLRDIFPSIASLSRHEVNEDIQSFEGIMKGTGHSLNSGLTRRNSKKNGYATLPGRRRTIINTPVCTVLGLVDTNLTGWGKTTRRPRRKRCAGGIGGESTIL